MVLPPFRRILLFGSLGLLSLYVLLVASFSLQWRMLHDAPILMYLALLIDKFGYVPYRDFLDVNLPGSYLIYGLVGHLSGYSDLGFRIADLLYLTAISALTWLWMRIFGRMVAWASVILGAMLYFSYGQAISFQREFLILLPLLAALVATVRLPEQPFVRKYFIVGLLFGLAAAIKPHAALAMPCVLIYHAWDAGQGRAIDWKRGLLAAVSSAAGLGVPVLATIVYLWSVGALAGFVEMARNWWPLNFNITTELVIMNGRAFREYLWNGYTAGIFTLWLIPMGLGLWLALSSQTLSAAAKRRVGLLVCLAACYSVYTLLAGKFFPYHWFIYLYFVTHIAALCFVRQPADGAWWKPAASLLFLWVLVPVLLFPPTEFIAPALDMEIPPPKNGRVDEIAAFLSTNLREGETVQPLDWTGGAVHAMLLAQARLATPVVYDVIFYQHISSPYVQSWRQRFMQALQAAPPRFIIEIETNKPWVSGPDTTRQFPALQAFIAAEYSIALQGDGYAVWEHSELGK
ncbi:MAG: glycosyltransferase family 39 protein [Anaerolineales bacterium]|nr:glycosyltransferase family 39 protein [Anaerolineales bacterium]